MPLKILLADGNTIAQNMGKKILEAAGYDVITVSDGIAALKKMAEVRPNIVLLNVYLAGHSGSEICTKMKASGEMGKMPILLTVGKMEPFCAGEAIKAKADGLIIKPFEVKNLITVLEKLAEGLDTPKPAVVAAESQTSKRAGAGARKQTASPAFSPQIGAEVCDVCGHLNRDDAFACEQCDVPLAKSVALQQH